MKNLTGIIIEESLENKAVLQKVIIHKTTVVPVTAKHKTPWIHTWTLHSVEIKANHADEIAKEISTSLDAKHASSWYADFKNDRVHYLIFRDKVFKIDRSKKENYAKAIQYGLSLGIPDSQIDSLSSM